jgi:AraC-like DNA-binding protein
MTKRGELMTAKGEFKHDLNGVHSFNNKAGLSYSIDIADPNKMEIQMLYPDNRAEDVYHMIFVLKGHFQINNAPNNSVYASLSSNQHNMYRVMPGNKLMLKCGIEDEVMCINLDQSFVNKYLPEAHPVRKPKSREAATVFDQNMTITPEVNVVLQQLSQLTSVGYSEQLMMESKAIELLAHQLSQHEGLNSGPVYSLDDNKLVRMEKVKQIIIEHTGNQLSLKSLAHMVGTNEFDLKRDFKIAFGNTVYGYLKNYKMEQAKAMLINKALTVAEIAQKMGYKHATHFTSAFKKHFGYLPNKLRNPKLIGLMLLQATGDIMSYLEPMVTV